MEFYKTLKNLSSKAGKIATIGIVAAMPYACESCGYNGNKAGAAETRIEQCHPTPDPNNLEAVLNLR